MCTLLERSQWRRGIWQEEGQEEEERRRRRKCAIFNLSERSVLGGIHATFLHF